VNAEVVRAEWTKLRTLPGTPVSALATVAATIGPSAAVTARTTTADCPPGQCPVDTVATALSGVYAGQNVVVVLAVLAGTAEYATRTIHLTLAGYPRRAGVVAAKAIVVVGLTLAAALPAAVGALLVGRAVLRGNGFTAAAGYPTMGLTDEPTVRASLGTVLYLVMLALLGLGVGLLVRDTAFAVGAMLTLLYVLPIVAAFVPDSDLSDALRRIAPMTAGLAIQSTRDLAALPIDPWAGLGVLGGYAVAAIALATAVFAIRDH
jgi:ABC-2 type transport system permease protein